MKYPYCPLCGNQDSDYCFSERGFKVLACNVCQLFFISPYPHNSSEVHNSVMKYKYTNLKIQDPEKHYYSSMEFYKRYFPLILKECKNVKSILHVGCGTGYLLELLKRYSNVHRVGIELNIKRSEFARKIANCEIYQIPVEKFSNHNKFDVITMINVLSHISSFDSLFSSIHSLLFKDSKLILKVGELKKNVHKIAIYSWGIPDHLHFLGLNTLQFICKKYGFEVLRHDRFPLSDDLFSPNRFKAPGRSRLRNIIKQIALVTPFALSTLAKLYDISFGGSVYSSFVVLTPRSSCVTD